MYVALIVVPNSIARTRKHRPNRKKAPHSARLEYSALRVDEWNASALKYEARSKVVTCERRTHLAHTLDVLEGGQAHSRIEVKVLHLRLSDVHAFGAVSRFGSGKAEISAQSPLSVNVILLRDTQPLRNAHRFEAGMVNDYGKAVR